MVFYSFLNHARWTFIACVDDPNYIQSECDHTQTPFECDHTRFECDHTRHRCWRTYMFSRRFPQYYNFAWLPQKSPPTVNAGSPSTNSTGRYTILQDQSKKTVQLSNDSLYSVLREVNIQVLKVRFQTFQLLHTMIWKWRWYKGSRFSGGDNVNTIRQCIYSICIRVYPYYWCV